MTTIQLTKAQQNRLIELCNALFPEYVSSYGALPNGMMVFRKQESKDYEYIHWYEFCLNNLCDRIWMKIKVAVKENYIDNNVPILYLHLLSKKQHIIDAIYHFVLINNNANKFDYPLNLIAKDDPIIV